MDRRDLRTTLDAEAKALRQLAVATWLEKPSDALTFTVTLAHCRMRPLSRFHGPQHCGEPD
jgi:hypothetical protein